MGLTFDIPAICRAWPEHTSYTALCLCADAQEGHSRRAHLSPQWTNRKEACQGILTPELSSLDFNVEGVHGNGLAPGHSVNECSCSTRALLYILNEKLPKEPESQNIAGGGGRRGGAWNRGEGHLESPCWHLGNIHSKYKSTRVPKATAQNLHLNL